MNTEIKSAMEILSDWNWDCEWMQNGLTKYERLLKAMEAYHNQFNSNAGNVWVSVEDELPKEKGKTSWSEPVLVYANGDYFVDSLFKGTKEFWLSHREDISYWMPLPESPNYFYCKEWNNIGYQCEVQCDSCKNSGQQKSIYVGEDWYKETKINDSTYEIEILKPSSGSLENAIDNFLNKQHISRKAQSYITDDVGEVEKAAQDYSISAYARPPKQSEDEADYIQAVSCYSFKAGAEWQSKIDAPLFKHLESVIKELELKVFEPNDIEQDQFWDEIIKTILSKSDAKRDGRIKKLKQKFSIKRK